MKKYDITISTILMVVAAGLFTASSGLPEVEGRRHVAPCSGGIAVFAVGPADGAGPYGPLLPGRAL